MSKKTQKEKRHPILCPCCTVPMVSMKRVIIKDGGVFSWYICPRRRKNGERGCGHVSIIEFVHDRNGEYVDPLMTSR